MTESTTDPNDPILREARKFLSSTRWLIPDELHDMFRNGDPELRHAAAQAIVAKAESDISQENHLGAVVAMQTAFLSANPVERLREALRDEQAVPPGDNDPDIWFACRHPSALGLCAICREPAILGTRGEPACSEEHLAEIRKTTSGPR